MAEEAKYERDDELAGDDSTTQWLNGVIADAVKQASGHGDDEAKDEFTGAASSGDVIATTGSGAASSNHGLGLTTGSGAASSNHGLGLTVEGGNESGYHSVGSAHGNSDLGMAVESGSVSGHHGAPPRGRTEPIRYKAIPVIRARPKPPPPQPADAAPRSSVWEQPSGGDNATQTGIYVREPSADLLILQEVGPSQAARFGGQEHTFPPAPPLLQQYSAPEPRQPSGPPPTLRPARRFQRSSVVRGNFGNRGNVRGAGGQRRTRRSSSSGSSHRSRRRSRGRRGNRHGQRQRSRSTARRSQRHGQRRRRSAQLTRSGLMAALVALIDEGHHPRRADPGRRSGQRHDRRR